MAQPNSGIGNVRTNTALLEMAMAYSRSRVLCAAARLGVADALGDEIRSVGFLAEKCQADANALYRLLRALAAQLARDAPIYWCRGPEDPPLPGAVEIPDLFDLACWLARAQLYIGNDSGVTHLAAAVGTPVIAFFGPTSTKSRLPRVTPV